MSPPEGEDLFFPVPFGFVINVKVGMKVFYILLKGPDTRRVDPAGSLRIIVLKLFGNVYIARLL
jgi:hypothetical protein